MQLYQLERGITAGKALEEWDEYSITQKIYDGYWEYHTERIENAFEDINSLLATGEHAW